jgi:phasin
MPILEAAQDVGRSALQETTMMKGTTPPFEIPNEMRAVAERSVEQAKLAFNNYMQAAQEAVASLEERVKASQVGAQGISKKAMSYAERNVLSTFEFAQKIVQAKDIQEFVKMQTDFVQSQMQALSDQVKDIGETATKTAMESVKTPNKGGAS